MQMLPTSTRPPEISHGPPPPAPAPPKRNSDGWDPALIACAVFLATSVGRTHQIFPILSLFQPVMLSGAAAIGLVLISRDPRRNVRRSWSRPLTFLVAFVCWAVLSIPGSLWPGGSFTMVFDEIGKTVFFAIILVAAIRTVRDAERIALVYFISAAIYAMMVYLRMGGGSGRIDGLYTYDANDFAVFAVSAIPMGVYFLVRMKGALKRLLCLAGLGFILLTFLGVQSRGGFLALVACAGTMLLTFRIVKSSTRYTFAGVGAVVFLLLAGPTYLERIETIWKGEQDYNRTAEDGRLEVWKRGLGYMARRPIFGVGAGQYGTAEGTLSELAVRQQWGVGVKWSTAHNTYVQTGAELGIPGAVFFILFLGATMQMLRRAARLPSTDPASGVPLTQALLASLVGFAIGAVFLSMAHLAMPYVLTGIALGALKVTAPWTAVVPARVRTAPRRHSYAR